MSLMSHMMQLTGSLLRRASYGRQMRQGRPPLSLWGLADEDGVLTVGGASAVALAAAYGTPLLVVDEKALRAKVAEVRAVLDDELPGARLTYSYKTNCIPGILRVLHDAGVGAEAISAYEYWLAQSLGVPGEQLIYNGVDKSPESLAMAVAHGALINIDNRDEVDAVLATARAQGRVARIGLRLGLNRSAQFGLDPDSAEGDGDIAHVVARCKAHPEHASLEALHFNVTSNARHSGYHVRCLALALDVMRTLARVHGVHIRLLDVGGGFGVQTSKNMSGVEYGLYRLFGVAPGGAWLDPFQDFRLYIRDMAALLTSYCRDNGLPQPVVCLEPGRLLTSGAELLLTRVKAVKERPGAEPFAITDGGRLSQAYPCDFEWHEAFLANDLRRPLARAYTVTGRVCTRSDWLYRGKVMPELAPGDILAVLDAGAYFSSYAMNFAFPRAAVVGVEDGRARVMRHRETFRHLTAMDEVQLVDVKLDGVALDDEASAGAGPHETGCVGMSGALGASGAGGLPGMPVAPGQPAAPSPGTPSSPPRAHGTTGTRGGGA